MPGWALGTVLWTAASLIRAFAQEAPPTASAGVDATAHAAPPTAEPSTTRTPHFLAHGLQGPDRVRLLAWAEEVYGRIEEFIRQPIPFSPQEPLPLFLQAAPDEPEGALHLEWVEGPSVRQPRLFLRRPDRVDQEDLLETLTQALLMRVVQTRSDDPARSAAVLPAWMSVGVAQNLYPRLRARNRALLAGRARRGETFCAETLLTLNTLPRGRAVEKAACGLLLEWLATTLGFPGLVDSLFNRWAAGASVPPGDVAATLFPGAEQPATALEQAWQEWLKRKLSQPQDWGRLTTEDVQALRAVLTPKAHALAAPLPKDLPPIWPPALLVQHLGEAWVMEEAAALRTQLERLGMGKPPEYTKALAPWKTLYAVLSRPRPASLWSRLVPGAGRRRATRLLRAAEKNLDEFARLMEARRLFLDEAEQALAAERDRPPDAARAEPPDSDGPPRDANKLDSPPGNE